MDRENNLTRLNDWLATDSSINDLRGEIKTRNQNQNPKQKNVLHQQRQVPMRSWGCWRLPHRALHTWAWRACNLTIKSEAALRGRSNVYRAPWHHIRRRERRKLQGHRKLEHLSRERGRGVESEKKRKRETTRQARQNNPVGPRASARLCLLVHTQWLIENEWSPLRRGKRLFLFCFRSFSDYTSGLLRTVHPRSSNKDL